MCHRWLSIILGPSALASTLFTAEKFLIISEHCPQQLPFCHEHPETLAGNEGYVVEPEGQQCPG